MNPAQINPHHADPEWNPEQRAACQPIERYFQGHARDDASCMRPPTAGKSPTRPSTASQAEPGRRHEPEHGARNRKNPLQLAATG